MTSDLLGGRYRMLSPLAVHPGRQGEGIGVVVESVEGEDHRAGLAVRQPGAQRQYRTVGGDEAVAGKGGVDVRRPDLWRRRVDRVAGGEADATGEQAGGEE